MRAALLQAWPNLAQFGVYPWNFHLLSMAELQQYLDALEEMARR